MGVTAAVLHWPLLLLLCSAAPFLTPLSPAGPAPFCAPTSPCRSQNQLCLWKYPSLAKVAEFTGHTSRVLHLAQSPDGTTVCSAAADETLRFWRCFAEATPAAAAKGGAAKAALGSSSSMLRSVNIR